MAKFRRARRVFSRAKKVTRRASRNKMFSGGMLGSVIVGAAVGVGLTLATPTINKYVPTIPFPILNNVRPTSAVVLGAGVIGKVMHKGGKYADAAVMLGAAMTTSDIISGYLGTSQTSSGAKYFS